MGTPVTIILGAILIAVAIAGTNRWQIVAGPQEGRFRTIFRMDRLTGRVQVCSIDADTLQFERSLAGAKFKCEVK
jgi:hypothetical protein